MSAEVLSKELVFSFFEKRREDAHKGDFGKAALVCGSFGMAGAAVLSARACVICGAGLTNVVCDKDIYPIIASHIAEPIFTLVENDITPVIQGVQSADAVGIGCGLGKSDKAKDKLLAVLENSNCPIVIDADGINLLSTNIDLLKKAKSPIVLTPHVMEMSRLSGLSVDFINKNRESVAIDFAKEHNVCVVLKGKNTVIAFGDKVYINPTGNSGMATGGSGDVLTGMIVSFLAQGMSLEKGVLSAVYLHGLCGDIGAKALSEHCLTPSAMMDFLPQIFLEIEGRAQTS